MSATILPYITQSELAQAMADEYRVTWCVCDWSQNGRVNAPAIVALNYEDARIKGYDVLGVIEPRNLWHRGAA